jgi:hypothetical protein
MKTAKAPHFSNFGTTWKCYQLQTSVAFAFGGERSADITDETERLQVWFGRGSRIIMPCTFREFITRISARK